MKYKEKLQNAYLPFWGIDNNSCIYAEQCAADMCKDGIRFNCAHLGNKYGADPKKPKILIVGKEPVSEHRRIKETVSLEDAGNNSHYLKTLYTLSLLLGDPADKHTRDSLIEKEYLLQYFCLTNYFKCVFDETKVVNDVKSTKTHSDKKTNSQMTAHCAKILIEEIKALSPDIVVIQGKDADNSKFRKLINSNFKKGVELFAESGIWLYKHEYENNSFYILWSYHPTAHMDLWAKKLDIFEKAITYLRKVINSKSD